MDGRRAVLGIVVLGAVVFAVALPTALVGTAVARRRLTARDLAGCLAVAALLFVLTVSLWPGPALPHNDRFEHLLSPSGRPLETMFNLVLYAPAAFAAAVAWPGRRTVAGIAALPVAVEVAQLAVEALNRWPSLFDVGANLAGAAVGLAAGHLAVVAAGRRRAAPSAAGR